MNNKKKYLNEAMKDEKQAPIMYKKLVNTLNTKRDKKIVHGIIKQEREHLSKLKQIRERNKSKTLLNDDFYILGYDYEN
jgi:rubrerythrin